LAATAVPVAPAGPGTIGFAAGAAIMAMAGLADDIRGLSSTTKLIAQLIASAAAVAGGVLIRVIYVPGIGPVELGAFGYPVTLLWLVGATNAFNFMDGLDGLAGGTAVLAAIFLCAVAILLGEPGVALLALLLAAATGGFLVFNFPPARIFMGDVGSQFLGFSFAALGVLLGAGDASGTIILVVPLLLFHFLFDTVFTAFRRWRRGENLADAHRTHLYQLLNRSGFTHRQVAGVHYLTAIVQGLLSLWLVSATPAQRWLVFVALLAAQGAYAVICLRLYSVSNKSVTP
jgi:UDP-GlcNAc:undecaprenyl-phosphate GlcNAc-1-phosphate transferase